MESFITEIKQIRIPRPKFEPCVPSTSSKCNNMARPPTPPRDYDDMEAASTSQGLGRRFQLEGGNDYRFPESKK